MDLYIEDICEAVDRIVEYTQRNWKKRGKAVGVMGLP